MRIDVGKLRHMSKEMVAALERNEEVMLVYRHRVCGRIVPIPRMPERQRVTWHPFFAMFPRYGPRDPWPCERGDRLCR